MRDPVLAAPGASTVQARPAGEGPVALALAGVGKRYGGFEALRPLTLSVRTGERIAIVGPSGAGKSTLLRLINTSLAPSTGALTVLGREVERLSPRELRALRSRIGTIYQQLLLVPQSTVMQNVVAGRLGSMSLARALLALVSREEADRVERVLAAVGIPEKLHERADRLSGGEQQRVAIARALYQDPELVIADEPLASIDPARSEEIIELFARTFAGRTLLVSTHRLEPLLPYVSRVIGLRGGELAFDKPSAALTLDDLGRLYASSRGSRPPGRRLDLSPAPVPATGLVAVGASSTPGEYVLPRAVRDFVRAHPGVKVTLAVEDSQEVTAALLERRIELAFVGARVEDPALHVEDFAADEILLVASPALEGLPPEPVPAEVAARLPRVERAAGSGTRAVVEDHFANLGAPLDPAAVALEVGTLVGLRAAVLSGMGVAFTSRLAVRDDLESGHLRAVRVEGVRIPRHLFVAWRLDRPLSPAARAFLEIARASAGSGRDGR